MSVSVAVNLVATQASGSGFATAYADGAGLPPTAVLNYRDPAAAASSSAIVAVGDSGRICFDLSASAHLVVDVAEAFYGDTHNPVQPFRAVDTRTAAKPSAQSVTCTRVAGVGGIPADAAAVSLNIGSIQPEAGGFFTLYPQGTPQPNTSNLNFQTNDALNNGATVAVGESGRICVYTETAAHHTIDVDGWFAADSDVQILPSATRLVDTRETTRLTSGSTTCVDVLGNGVPANTESVLLGVTAIRGDARGFVTAHASGAARPPVSIVAYSPGMNRTTSGWSPVGEDGEVCLYVASAADLVVDLTAYRAPAAPPPPPGPGPGPTGGVFTEQFRALDTRLGIKPEAEETRCVRVVGQGGITDDVTAVAVNMAVTQAEESGFAVTFPAGADVPETSSVNVTPAQNPVGPGVGSSNTIVEVGNAGQVCVYVSQSMHVVLDVHAAYYGSTYTPVQPIRITDTRTGPKPATRSVTCTQIAGVGGVPADAASVSVNLGAAQAEGRGFLTAFASGLERPDASNLNYGPGETVNNGAVVALGADGEMCLFASVATHQLIDVNGWFSAGSGVQALPTPRRLLDTRDASPRAAGSTICLPVVGAGVPVDAISVQISATAVRPAEQAFVTLHPAGIPRPDVSSLNTVPGVGPGQWRHGPGRCQRRGVRLHQPRHRPGARPAGLPRSPRRHRSRQDRSC